MSSESDNHGDNDWYTLECICGSDCPCRKNHFNPHLNAVRSYMQNGNKVIYWNFKTVPVFEGENCPEKHKDVKTINIRGRLEHEAVIKDAALCKELGLDQAYETMMYLKRWGCWLSDN